MYECSSPIAAEKENAAGVNTHHPVNQLTKRFTKRRRLFRRLLSTAPAPRNLDPYTNGGPAGDQIGTEESVVCLVDD